MRCPSCPKSRSSRAIWAPPCGARRFAGSASAGPKSSSPPPEPELKRALAGAKFQSLSRRGKYLLLTFRSPALRRDIVVLGHLGMTGRMYIQRKSESLPKHAAVVMNLGSTHFIYEDTRYFGRFTLDLSPLTRLGPEPLSPGFSSARFARDLKRSRQAVKVKLLDQTLVAGVGNIYASEALFRAGIPPRRAASRLTAVQAKRLHRAIREVLGAAIKCGSTLPLNYSGGRQADRLFYFGRAPGAPDYYEERLCVYDRVGKPCPACGLPIRRIVQAARSTFFCENCQKG